MYSLMDIESANMVGRFESRREALAAVAATARRYGTESNEVLSLVLYRDDGPPETGFVAEGAELVRLALAETATRAAPKTASKQATPAG